jgi:hypothetical protein
VKTSLITKLNLFTKYKFRYLIQTHSGRLFPDSFTSSPHPPSPRREGGEYLVAFDFPAPPSWGRGWGEVKQKR